MSAFANPRAFKMAYETVLKTRHVLTSAAHKLHVSAVIRPASTTALATTATLATAKTVLVCKLSHDKISSIFFKSLLYKFSTQSPGEADSKLVSHPHISS